MITIIWAVLTAICLIAGRDEKDWFAWVLGSAILGALYTAGLLVILMFAAILIGVFS